MKFWQLPSSLLLATLSCALPIAHAEVLTPDNFKSTVAHGVWFVEHFSPYCGHCRAFAPTWEQLAGKADKNEFPGVKLAQVDCSVNGDLCDLNGVTGYPTMQTYREGEMVEVFQGRREMPRLEEFLHKYESEYLGTAIIPSNPDGQVLELTPDNFESTLQQGPAFVKFFAPWCGHCKKLAPNWTKLAVHLQNKLTIAEVNCEKHGSLCSSQGVEGYPALVYYTDGQKTDYHGGRKLDQLKTFTEKVTGSASTAISPDELDKVVKENEVAYVLVHREAYAVKQLTPFITPLLGSPPVFTISNPPASFYDYNRIASEPEWTFLVYKDRDLVSTYSANEDLQGLSHWLGVHRLPSALELTQETFQEVMNAPHRPLVVLAAVPPAVGAGTASANTVQKASTRLKELAKKWRMRNTSADRDVVFAWMDAERWKDWLKSMYGVQGAMNASEVDDVQVVIADHQELVYYPTDGQGAQLRLTSSEKLFGAIEGAMRGEIKAMNSENVVERMARYLNTKMVALERAISAHPYYTVAIFFAILGTVIMGIRKVLSDDVSYVEREYEKGRVGRLD